MRDPVRAAISMIDQKRDRLRRPFRETQAMRGIKLSLAVASCGVLALALWASAQVGNTGGAMATAAERLLKALDKDQTAQATFPFDSPERLNWHFIPRERKGLPIKSMTGDQRALTFGLIHTGVSGKGFLKATTIMSLEAILKELEQGRGPVRDPERYFISIFGTPSNRGKWGWRIEGHHISLNFTMDDGKITSATPAFFGSNPAEVRQGPREGLRTLADVEDRALRFLQALNDDQKKVAMLAEKAPGEIKSGTLKAGEGLTPDAPKDSAEGVAAKDLSEMQQQLLRGVIDAYAGDMPGAVRQAWADEIKAAGFEKIHFGWYGATDRNQPHAYKVQGPTFLIEFNNTQNNANHIHSLYRSTMGDFGRSS
jgi:hypothetical protein